MGLDDLVTDTLADYERLAIELARNAAHFRELRERTARNRLTSPLFDAARYCRHIEAAYKQMMQIHRKGEAPRNFSVTQLE
jgi:predicted O-linked N-acetylglucosamine transferase (SPINDLY family)